MSASNAPYSDKSRAAEQRAHEPSMEEILASIRRIIADDQPLALTPRGSIAPETRIHVQSIAAEDAQAEAAERQDEPAPAAIEPKPQHFAEAPATAAHVETEAETQPEPAFAAPVQASEPPLISAATDASVATAFQALAATRMMPTGDAINEMVRDMLRPMLKTWLDDNLPVLVERLVRAEIERVARGGR